MAHREQIVTLARALSCIEALPPWVSGGPWWEEPKFFTCDGWRDNDLVLYAALAGVAADLCARKGFYFITKANGSCTAFDAHGEAFRGGKTFTTHAEALAAALRVDRRLLVPYSKGISEGEWPPADGGGG